MHLNTLKPAPGSKKKRTRVGRGIGSGIGKTCGRGHKGQKARGAPKIGFEGGQMALQFRLPKFGFTSRVSKTRAQVRLNDLDRIVGDSVGLNELLAARLISSEIKVAKIIASGQVGRSLTVRAAQGVLVTKGAREAIIAAGGKVE